MLMLPTGLKYCGVGLRNGSLLSPSWMLPGATSDGRCGMESFPGCTKADLDLELHQDEMQTNDSNFTPEGVLGPNAFALRFEF